MVSIVSVGRVVVLSVDSTSSLETTSHSPFSLFSQGFGLPHTDENPYNSNLGNCLGQSRFTQFVSAFYFNLLNCTYRPFIHCADRLVIAPPP